MSLLMDISIGMSQTSRASRGQEIKYHRRGQMISENMGGIVWENWEMVKLTKSKPIQHGLAVMLDSLLEICVHLFFILYL